MWEYRFNGKKGHFYVYAGPHQQQAIVDRIQELIGFLLKAILVQQVLNNGQHLPTAGLGRDWVGLDQQDHDAEADPDVGDILIEGMVLRPCVEDHPQWEYEVCLEFKDPFSNRPRNWACRLLTTLVTDCTPLTACTEEDAAEMMLSEHCAMWGFFTLDRSALLILLQGRYRVLSDAAAVEKTIVQHMPLRRRADIQHRRDMLRAWRAQFPGEVDRLQHRRCDQALKGPGAVRPPYKVGWRGWMNANLGQQPNLDRPLVLIGSPALKMADWARSHGPHVFMQGRLDLALLHDCLADGDARCVVIDEIPWGHLLREDSHGHSVLTNGTFSWYHGRRLQRTTQHLPVIVLKSHLPNPNDSCWEPRGWQHWKSILQIVKLLPDVPLFEPATITATTNTAGPTEQQEGPVMTELQGRVREPRTRTEKKAQLLAAAVIASEDDRAAEEEEEEKEEEEKKMEPGAAAEEEKMQGAARLKLDMARRVQYGPDSFLYPDAVPVAHQDRLLHVVAAIDYVQMKYRGRDLARQKDFQSDDIAGSYAFYEYTGSVPDVWHLGDWSPEILELRDALRDQIDELINSMVANQYLDRHACIDHHSDKTPDIKRATSIWTVSLGATRSFELRALDGSETLAVQLTHGSVFQIGPLTNAAYTHSILPADHEVGPRYGLTFRTLASRWLHEEEVALRQPARDGEPWLVQRKASRRDERGQVVLRRQDAYPSRRVIHLEPFALADPSHVQEQDIIRLRQVLPTLKRVRPSGAPAEDDADDVEENANKSNRKKKRKVGAAGYKR